MRLFQYFIPAEETIEAIEYLGVQGFWWIGTHSFGCLTNRRVATLQTSIWGLNYQDGYLKHINSGRIYQPSKFILYSITILTIILAFFSFVLLFVGGLVSMPLIIILLLFWLIVFGYGPRVYYRFYKCGLYFSVREGENIYLFTNHNRLTKANRLYRKLIQYQESNSAYEQSLIHHRW